MPEEKTKSAFRYFWCPVLSLVLASPWAIECSRFGSSAFQIVLAAPLWMGIAAGPGYLLRLWNRTRRARRRSYACGRKRAWCSGWSPRCSEACCSARDCCCSSFRSPSSAPTAASNCSPRRLRTNRPCRSVCL